MKKTLIDSRILAVLTKDLTSAGQKGMQKRNVGENGRHQKLFGVVIIALVVSVLCLKLDCTPLQELIIGIAALLNCVLWWCIVEKKEEEHDATWDETLNDYFLVCTFLGVNPRNSVEKFVKFVEVRLGRLAEKTIRAQEGLNRERLRRSRRSAGHFSVSPEWVAWNEQDREMINFSIGLYRDDIDDLQKEAREVEESAAQVLGQHFEWNGDKRTKLYEEAKVRLSLRQLQRKVFKQPV